MAYIDDFIKKIRFYIKDFKGKNLLIQNEDKELTVENTDEEIKFAIEFVLDWAEVEPPLEIKQPLETWGKFGFFKWGVIAYLLDSNAILGIRNTMPISDGGSEINDTYKAGPYSTQAMNLWNAFQDGLRKYKIHYNLTKFQWSGTSGSNPFAIYGRYYY